MTPDDTEVRSAGTTLHAWADSGGQVFQSAGPQTIYGLDMLHPEPIAPNDLTVAMQAFVDPPGMQSAREALGIHGVAVLVAEQGDGASTAAVRLLGEYKANDGEYVGSLQTLTVDWAIPNTSRIPREPRVGYLLDLTAEDEELRAGFRSGLVRLGSQLVNSGSCLVVLVTRDQWGDVTRDPELKGITAPLGRPDARALAIKHVNALHRRPDRLPSLDRNDISNVLSSQAKPGLAAELAHALAIAEGENLEARLREVLEWREYVRQRFDDTGEQWERALLWTVAALDGAPKRVIIEAARDLLNRLKITIDLGQALVKRDLTSCLTTIQARQHDGTVSINAGMPGVASVVLAHIWQEYVELRDVMLDWLTSIGARGGVAASFSHEVSQALLSLAEHDDGGAVLSSLSAWVNENTGRRDLIARLLEDAAFEGKVERPARKLLLDWAKTTNTAQHAVVAQVCGGRFGRRYPERALVRLRWLFVKGGEESKQRAGDALRALVVSNEDINCAVLNTVLAWDVEVALAAFTMAITATTTTLPQLAVLLDPVRDPAGEVERALVVGWRIIFSSRENTADQVAALRSWFDAAGTGALPGDRVMAILRAAGSSVLGGSSVIGLAIKATQDSGGTGADACAQLINGLMADVAA